MAQAERDTERTPDVAREALVRQVLASRTFAKSARLSHFFEFVCRKTLDGHPEEVNEQQIGVHVFGRSPAYNANDDSIVRSQGRLLRQRLEEYFEHECPACPVVILIPKGGYVPVFERRPQPASLPTAEGPGPVVAAPGDLHGAVPGGVRGTPFDNGPAHQAVPRRGVRLFWLAALSVAGLALLWLLFHPLSPASSSSSSALWRSFFVPGRPVVIVPSDDGLVLSEEVRRAPVTLDDYLSGDYLRHAAPVADGAAAATAGPLTSDWLSSHQYTSTADLDLAMRLSRLPEAADVDLEPRYARVLRLDDLKNNNVILIGGIGANPWVGLYSPRLNFDVNYDWKTSEGYVINKHPRPGEQAKYLESHADGSVSNYGVLAYLPGISGNGSALLFEGSGMAGTEAAADFPFNQTAFSDFIRHLGRGPHGALPYFEVLLETRSLGGNAPEAHVLAWRVIRL